MQGGAAYIAGSATFTDSKTYDNAASSGATFYSSAGSSIVYLLPAPPGYWVPASECKVYREACGQSDTACLSAEAACALDTNETASGCQPVTFYQPCDWSTFPEFVGQTIYSLPQGAYDDDLPFACSAGVLGGNGSITVEQTSATCAGFCPAGSYCPTEATTEPTPCPAGSYCELGS